MSKLAIAGIVLLVVIVLIMALPTIHIDHDAVVSSNAYAYIRAALYFVPTGTVAAIGTIIFGLWGWRVIVSLIKTIWDILPIA